MECNDSHFRGEISVATFPSLEFRNLEGMSVFLSVFPFLSRIGNQGFLFRKTFLPAASKTETRRFVDLFLEPAELLSDPPELQPRISTLNVWGDWLRNWMVDMWIDFVI